MIPKEKEGVHLVEKAELLMGRCREEEKERDNQTLILIQISDAVDTEEENFDKEDR